MSLRHSRSEDVEKVREDLSNCRSRLEAGIEENKRNRDLIQEIVAQIQRIRQRTTHESNRLISPTLHTSSLPQLAIDISSSPYIDYIIPSHHLSQLVLSRPLLVRDFRNRSLTNIDEYSSPIIQSSSSELRYDCSPMFRSSPLLLQYTEDTPDSEEQYSIDEIISRLKNELFKNNTLEEINDMLREENDAALEANNSLRHDVVQLSRTLEQLEHGVRNDRARFNMESARYRNQMEQQHRKLTGLWKSFMALKRKVRELHASTASDLDKQLTEFTRCAAIVKKAIRHAEFKNVEWRDKVTKEKDMLLEEIMVKYEHLSTSQIETEKQLIEKTRQLQKLQEEYQQTRRNYDDVENALIQICNMSQHCSPSFRQRARSESPSFPHMANDAIRKIRSVLSMKSAEIKEVNMRFEHAESEVIRLKKQIDVYESEKNSKKDYERRRDQEANERESQFLAMEHELRRTTERLSTLEQERNMKDSLITTMQNTLTSTHRNHKEFIEGLVSNHRDELIAREKLHEKEITERLNEEHLRLDRMQREVDREKVEVESLRQQLRNLKIEHSKAKNLTDEKDSVITKLEEMLSNLKSKMDAESAVMYTKEKEITENSILIEKMMSKEQQLKQDLADMTAFNTELSERNNFLQEQVLQLRAQVDKFDEKNDIFKQGEEWKGLFEKSQQQNIAYEQDIQSLKESVKHLEEKLVLDAEKTKIVRDQLEHQRTLTKEKNHECNEMIKQIEEMKFERSCLLNDISTIKSELDAAYSQVAKAKDEAERTIIDKHQELAVLDSLRLKSDQLANEVEKKEILIEDLQEQLRSMQLQLVEKDNLVKAQKVRYEESISMMEKEYEYKWSEKLRNVQEDLSKKRNLAKEYEHRLEQVTQCYQKVVEEEQNAKIENIALKEKLNELMLKHKREVEELIEQNNWTHEDLEKEMQQLENTKNALLVNLREDLSRSEAETKEAVARERSLHARLNDATKEIKCLQQEMKEEIKKRNEQEENYKRRDESQERALQAVTTELQESQNMLANSSALLEEAYRKKQITEENLEKLEIALAKKSSLVKELEEKVDNMVEMIRENDSWKQKYEDQIATLEKTNINLNMARDKSMSELVEEQRKTLELEQSIREMNRTVQIAELKARSERECRNERDEKVRSLLNKIKELETQLTDHTTKCDLNVVSLKNLDSDRQTMMKELNKHKELNTELTRKNEEMSTSLKAIEKELATTKALLEKKAKTSKQAIADLLSNYRDSEKRSMESDAECEQLRAYIRTIKSKLDSFEKHRVHLEAQNVDLVKKLDYYEKNAGVMLDFAGSTPSQQIHAVADASKAPSSGVGDSRSMICTTFSSHDLSYKGSPEEIGRGSDNSSNVNSSIEITSQFLKERIEQLEKDKVELSNDLVSQREELKESIIKVREYSNTVQSLENQLAVLRKENESLESRLMTQRQLYLSNEEAIRAKDLEYRGLKAKITSAELHIREKDSKIDRLMCQLETMSVEVSRMAEEKQKLSSMAKVAEQELKSVEENAGKLQDERELLAKQLAEAKEEIKSSRDRLIDYESQLQQMKNHLDDTMKQQHKDREELEKFRIDGNVSKQMESVVKDSLESSQISILGEKLSQLQYSYDMLLSKNYHLIAEIDRLRQELRESNHRFDQVNLKLSERERLLESANEMKKKLVQQASSFQKAEVEWEKLEREMRDELAFLRKDRLVLTSDLEELKRKLVRAEIERKEVDSMKARLDREVASLKKHVEALEEDKSRIETAIRNSLNERRAIDKSLAAMEKENAELYRNCAHLQSQIAHLERDSDPNSVAKLLKDHGHLQEKIAKLVMEKNELEMVIQRNDLNYAQKRKMMESQLTVLRNQLELEKKRRFDMQKVTRGDTVIQQRHFSRTSDLRMSKSKSIRQVNPFRMHVGRAVSCELYRHTYHRYESSLSSISTRSFLTNDTSTSFETVIF